jgi:hypothetical protein
MCLVDGLRPKAAFCFLIMRWVVCLLLIRPEAEGRLLPDAVLPVA